MDSEGADVVTHDPTNPFQPRDMKQQLAALENGERHICGGAPSVVLTDIDALIAEAKEAVSQWLDCRDEENAHLTTRLIAALTTEREKVAALETEVERLRGALKRLSFAAQTTGGVAGRDEGLVAAIDNAALTAHTEVRGQE